MLEILSKRFKANDFMGVIAEAEGFLVTHTMPLMGDDLKICEILGAAYSRLVGVETSTQAYLEQAILHYKMLLTSHETANDKKLIKKTNATLLSLLERLTSSINLDDISEAKLNELAQSLLDIKADNAMGINLKAISKRREGQYEAAEALYYEAIKTHKDTAIFWSGLGMIAIETGDDQKMMDCFQTALSLQPDNVKDRNNLAVSLYDMGKDSEALALLNYEGDLHKSNAIFNANRCYISAQAHLRQGNWQTGWALYESRWGSGFCNSKSMKNFYYNSDSEPAKKGQLKGNRILVYSEQGNGDMLMMMRFLPLLAAQVERLYFVNLHSGMRDIYTQVPSIMEAVIEISSSKIPPHDVHCGIMSLPFLLDIDKDNLPPLSTLNNQINISQGLTQKWQKQIKTMIAEQYGKHDFERLFALAIYGNPRLKKTHHRDIELAQLEHAFQDNDVVLILQKHLHPTQRAFIKDRPNYIYMGDVIESFLDTAAILTFVDAAISIDSSLAHLAGNQQIPTFILLPKPAEWRWQIAQDSNQGEKCIWYPSACLLRQSKIHDWQGIDQRLAEKLNELTPKIDHLTHIPATDALEQAQTLFTAHKYNESMAAISSFLTAYPNHGRGNHIQAVLYATQAEALKKDHHDAAIKLYNKALQFLLKAHENRPSNKAIIKQTNRCLQILLKDALAKQQQEQAIHYSAMLLRLSPINKIGLSHLSRLYRLQAGSDINLLLRALGYNRKWIEVDPENHEAHYNIALIHSTLQQWDKAKLHIEKSLAFLAEEENGKTKLLYEGSLAIAMQELGEYEAANQCFIRLLAGQEAAPRNNHEANLRFAYALSSLTLGDYQTGFANYEYRASKQNAAVHQSAKWHLNMSIPEWDGKTDIKGKKILVLFEQGFGDNIMFSRFIPALREKGAQIDVLTSPQMKPLIECVPEVHQLHTKAEKAIIGQDFHVLVASLPYLLHIELNKLPPPVNFNIAPALIEKWKDFIDEHQPYKAKQDWIKIGFTYHGSHNHGKNRTRSLKLIQFLQLKTLIEAEFSASNLRPIQWVALHIDFPKGDHGILSKVDNILLLNEEIENFTDSAAIAKNMDVMLSIDSSMAHLSASLGVDTRILVTSPPDFRWMLARDDSPWYPSASLYRQAQLNQWHVSEQKAGGSVLAPFEAMIDDLLMLFFA